MKPEIRERREYMIQEYSRSFSQKQVIEATANKFEVSQDTLYVDWSRRNSWLKEIVDFKDSSNMIRLLLVEVRRSLQEIEELAANADNDNCRLGAHKLRVNVLFKLVDLYRTYDNEELRERIERLERAVGEGVVIT